MKCNAMQYNTIQCNAMQCNAMQCNAMQCNAMQCNAMQCKRNAMQCNAMQYNITIQYYNITADLLQIICRHVAFIPNSSTSETATRTASSSCVFETIPLHVIPFSLQKRLMLLELKPRCSGYVVFKTSAKSSTVFSFLDKNSNSIEKTWGSRSSTS